MVLGDVYDLWSFVATHVKLWKSLKEHDVFIADLKCLGSDDSRIYQCQCMQLYPPFSCRNASHIKRVTEQFLQHTVKSWRNVIQMHTIEFPSIYSYVRV